MGTRSPPIDPAVLFEGLVALVADAVVARLHAGGRGAASSAEPPSTWYTQDTSPIALRTYLELCRSGKIERKKIGKKILVRREALDAWIVAHGATPSTPSAPAPSAPAPTDAELMAKAGFSRVAPTKGELAPASSRGRRTARRGR